MIQTRLGMEKTADRCIDRLGFEHYLPLYAKTVSHARKREEVLRPLFPLYVFVRFALGDDWGNLLHVVGVQTILGINRMPGIPKAVMGHSHRPHAGLTETHTMAKRPLPMPDSVIFRLKANAAANHGVIELAAPDKPRINLGDTVKIVDGPFADFRGLVHRDQKTRVFVLLDFLGREMEIPFERDSLELVQRAVTTVSPSVEKLTQNLEYAAAS